MTLAGHLETLAELRRASLGAMEFTAAIRAEELRGKASGYYVERQEVGPPDSFGDDRRERQAALEAKLFKLGVVRALPLHVEAVRKEKAK